MERKELLKEWKERQMTARNGGGLRLDADEDIDWITTESGSHIPLKNGKAIGGAGGKLNGQDFSKAKSTKSGSAKSSGGSKSASSSGKSRGQTSAPKRTAPSYSRSEVQKDLKYLSGKPSRSATYSKTVMKNFESYLGGLEDGDVVRMKNKTPYHYLSAGQWKKRGNSFVDEDGRKLNTKKMASEMYEAAVNDYKITLPSQKTS